MPQLPFLTDKKANVKKSAPTKIINGLLGRAHWILETCPEGNIFIFLFGASDSLNSLTLALGRKPKFSKGIK